MPSYVLEPPLTNDYRKIESQKKSFQGPFEFSVSVVIPFYKNIQILTRTLASLVKQAYPSHLVEVIICDDGSEEPVHTVLDKFQKSLNLQYVRQAHLGNRVSTVRNIGIQSSNGEVIISLDFDMICPPNFITSHLSWFHVSDRIATIGPRKFIDANQVSVNDILFNFELVTQLPSIKSVSNKMRDIDKRIDRFKAFYDYPVPARYFYSCNVAYKRDQALAIGGFDEAYDYNFGYEDIDFGHRLWLSGTFLAAELDALAYHQENLTTTLQERNEGKEVNRRRAYEKFPELRYQYNPPN